MNTPEPAYLTVNETVAYLRSGRSFVYDLIRHGEIETVKRGTRRLVVLSSLRAYVERERTESAT